MREPLKERPILFSGAMVTALLEGRKTQTRRVVQGDVHGYDVAINAADTSGDVKFGNAVGGPVTLARTEWITCPYGSPGSRLWVRETFALNAGGDWIYRASTPFDAAQKWRPSLFMPRAASRITLELCAIRVERVQDISEQDAEAEGANRWGMVSRCDAMFGHGPRPEPHRDGTFAFGFEVLWNRLNEKRGFGWSVNPFCWVLSFRVVGM